MDSNKLIVVFGKDQEVGVDTLLEEMLAEGKVIQIEKKDAADKGIRYVVAFDRVYDAYLFGYKSASLWKYATGDKPQQ